MKSQAVRKEYFEDPLNPTSKSFVHEAVTVHFGLDPSINRLCSGRTPGVDEICLEFLKALEVVGLF